MVRPPRQTFRGRALRLLRVSAPQRNFGKELKNGRVVRMMLHQALRNRACGIEIPFPHSRKRATQLRDNRIVNAHA